MTGKELILFILQNNLENEQMFNDDGIFVGFIGEEEAAARLGVGVATVRAFHNLGFYQGTRIGNSLYFLKTDMRGDKDE